MKGFDITYPKGSDLRSKIAQAYLIQAVPETFTVDKEGNIGHLHIGPLDEVTLLDVLESLLETGSPQGGGRTLEKILPEG